MRPGTVCTRRCGTCCGRMSPRRFAATRVRLSAEHAGAAQIQFCAGSRHAHHHVRRLHPADCRQISTTQALTVTACMPSGRHECSFTALPGEGPAKYSHTTIRCQSPSCSAQQACCANRGSIPNGAYSACSDVPRHRSTRKLDRTWVIHGCRDKRVKAWSRPTKKPDRPDPAKGNRRPGRSAKLLEPGYRHVGRRPPCLRAARPGAGQAARTTESRTARTKDENPFVKHAPGDGRPVGAIAITLGDRRQSVISSKYRHSPCRFGRAVYRSSPHGRRTPDARFCTAAVRSAAAHERKLSRLSCGGRSVTAVPVRGDVRAARRDDVGFRRTCKHIRKENARNLT
jgi:hypothetical protein